MASSTPKTVTADVQTLLATLRDNPIDNAGASDFVLAQIFTHLMNIPSNPVDHLFHWFCGRAAPTTIAAATFLIRLFAYNSPQVDVWKARFQSCLSGCSECVQGLEEAKVSSKDTYFGAFEVDVLKGFYKSFDQWELEGVLEALANAGISLHHPDSSRQRTLSDAPSAVVYNMVANLTILKDPRILSFIRSLGPSQPLPGWPTDPLPAGLLILMLDEASNVRRWARNQASRCTIVPIPREKFVGSYQTAVEAVAYALSSSNPSSALSSPAFPPPPDSYLASSTSPFSFASDPANLWSGFCAVLRLIPPESLSSSTHQHADLRRIVTSHLHDTGAQFVDVLRCLLFLLKRLGNKFWQGEGPEYPQIVFDAVKDNPAYSELLCNIEPSGERPWFLAWFAEYLHTIRELPVYHEILAKMTDFMCEELQHERFQDARPIIMVAATRLLSSVLRRSQAEELSRHRVEVPSILDIHAGTLVAVAFAPSYNDRKWKNARNSARDLITSALVNDVQDVSLVITQLCRFLAGHDIVVPAPTTRKEIWKRVYETLQTNDADGIVAIISTVARSAHLDILNKTPFSPAFQPSNSRKGAASAEAALDEVNHSLTIIRSGFLEALSKYADFNVSSSVLDVLRRPGMVKDIMVLMLSPVEIIQVAAQTLVGLAFDVDVRLDCFRALLENLPDAALEGIFEFLNIFIQFAPVVPEACSLSKSLVRCFTDLIEVLCASHDGLLHNPHFLRPVAENGPTAELPKLWNLMTKSITVIFKRTPLWSTYFENEDMIVWMRDALIFGRDMLAQWRVIETAANSQQSSSLLIRNPGKLSRVGKKMVNDLQDVLPELARWLRLTDEELLHQSFSLLQSLLDCFRETCITPSEAGIAKLTRHIDDARKKDPNRPQTRLDSTRLSKLENALAAFESDDDDIEIISHTIAPRSGQRMDNDVSKSKPKVLWERSVSRISLSAETLKSGTRTLPPARSKPSTSRFFTDQDQQNLDAAVSFPTFRKSNNIPVAGASKSFIPHAARRHDAGPKNEGGSRNVGTDESGSSESESEDDELPSGGGLATLGGFQRSPKVRKPAERRQVKTIDIPALKKPLQDRLNRRDDARRTALRLKPNVSGLHKVLLSWNYDHHGPEPPLTGEKTQLSHVPDKFTDYSQYRRVFEPLLLLECWSQIVQSKGESQDILECKVAARQYSDDYLDLDIFIPDSVTKDWYLTETDVVLLRHLDGKKCILAKTQSYRATPYVIQACLRCCVHPGNPDPGLQINTTWRLCKVFSLSTLHREYAALMSLPYYDLAEPILHPQLSKNSNVDPKEVQQTMLAYSVNEPQAVAISSSLRTEGFALIQGPPGTGKTSTICGLIVAFLSKRPRPAVAVHAGRNSGPADKGSAAKVLLCAPSNAAIDEIAHRIKEGFRGTERRPGCTKVVRLGADKAINISVKDISLDYLVEQKLDSNQKSSKDAGNDIIALRGEIEAVKQLKLQKLQEVSNVYDNGSRTLALEDEIKRLNSRRMALTQQFDRLKDKQKSDSRTLDATRRKLRVEVLQEADVICSTLSGAGHEILEQFDFEMIIIDEAAQAIELSSLIPLKYRCVRCIMVGDPQQLPPTVLSQEACRYQYNQSLFVRLQKHRPDAVHLLSIQYRMHPEISRLPSQLFYQGRLQDGPSMDVKTKRPWHSHSKFGIYRFFNISRGLEEQGGRSLKNIVECQVAVALYSRLCQEFSAFDFDFRVGVVSMYRAQIAELRRHFEQRFGRDIAGKVDFNTVDGFQGQEKDVIILSCVRAGPGLQSIGFLSDTRRMNVALTRAKSSLFILGNAATLERSDDIWRSIILDSRSRFSMTDMDVTYFTTPTGPPRLPLLRVATQPPSTQVIPTDLATPRDLKAAVDRGHSSMLSKSVNPAKNQLPKDTPPRTKDEEKMSLKRGAVDDLPDQWSTHTSRSHIEAANMEPRVPLVKRPKKPTLFIPKANKSIKRSSEDNPAGPSNHGRL